MLHLLRGWRTFLESDPAKTAAEVFLYQIVCRYGRVERLHTDRGAAFLSEYVLRNHLVDGMQTNLYHRGNAHGERLSGKDA